MIVGHISYGQSDTINKTNKAGLRQGWWVIKAKDVSHIPANCIPDSKIEEGRYKDNKKIGLWTEYYCKGNIKGEIPYKNGIPSGYCKFYFENGCIQEEGLFKKNKWVGDYKLYYFKKDTCGHLRQHFVFDSLGKRISAKYYPIEGQDSKTEIDTIISWPHYNKQDSLRLQLCSCDSIILHGETKLKMSNDQPPHLDWTGKGNYRLYNKYKQLSKCGYFYKAKLIYGYAYYYDEDNKLTYIQKYFNGFYSGNCILGEK